MLYAPSCLMQCFSYAVTTVVLKYLLVAFHVGGCFTLNKPFMFLLLLFPSILQIRNQEWEVPQLSNHAAQSLHASASPSYKPSVNSVQVT